MNSNERARTQAAALCFIGASTLAEPWSPRNRRKIGCATRSWNSLLFRAVRGWVDCGGLPWGKRSRHGKLDRHGSP